MTTALTLAVPLAVLALAVPARVCRADDAPTSAPASATPAPRRLPPVDRNHLTLEAAQTLGVSNAVRSPDGGGFESVLYLGVTITGSTHHVVAGLTVDTLPQLLGGTVETHVGIVLGAETQLYHQLHGQLTGQLGVHDLADIGSEFLGGSTSGDTHDWLPYAGARMAITLDSRIGAFLGIAATVRRDLVERDEHIYSDRCWLFCDPPPSTKLESWHVGGTEASLSFIAGWKL